MSLSTLSVEPACAAVPVCRICGCWADEACLDPLSPSGTCYWIQGDLCSVCWRELVVAQMQANIASLMLLFEHGRLTPQHPAVRRNAR